MAENALITFYFEDGGLVRKPANEARAYLQSKDWMSVYLEFNHPVTGALVQDSFTFYPAKEHYDPSARPMRYWIAEHQGLPLRVPSEISFWTIDTNHSPKTSFKTVPQKTCVLVRGEYVSVAFDLDVHCRIRVPADAPVPIQLA
jgi:hypothetical protein